MDYDDLTQKEKDIMDTILTLYFNKRLYQQYKSKKSKGEQDYNPASRTYVGTGGGNKGTPGSEVDNFVTNKDRYAQLAVFLRLLILEVSGAVATLKTDRSNDDFMLMKWSYLYKDDITNTKITDKDIAEELDVTETTVRNRRKKLVVDMYKIIDIHYYISNPLRDIAAYFERLLTND